MTSRFSVASGSVGATVDTTDVNGLASTSWTLGTTTGGQTLTATADGLTGSPISVSATATSGVATTTLAPQFDTLTAIYEKLAPDEMEGKKIPIYRKDMPLHRLYFHEIATPDKISGQMKALVQWVNDPDTKRSTHIVRLAAKTHYSLLQTYPFPKHSGKVARLILNVMLMDVGYPPVIIHATERQRYYEALKQGEDRTAALVNEALVASVESTISFYERLSEG